MKNAFARIDDGPAYPCKLHPGNWNGWALPVFGFDVAKRVAADNGLVYDSENDRFVESRDVGEELPEIQYYENTAKPGEPAQYAIGAWAWVWDAWFPEELAQVFSEELRDCLEPAEMDEIVEKNKTYGGGCCASHDYCDANMIMAAAFERFAGRPVWFLEEGSESEQSADTNFWNAAWDIAKASGFKKD